ncbi:MAG TPA: FAD-binding oxidoreductase [Solirubrobacteraceae bacterium]|jgi:alkyldihydroxyacetonephosphate synthase
MALARPTDSYPDQSWTGWGDPALLPVLSEGMRQLLRAGLGVDGASAGAPPSLDSLALAAGRLGDADLTALAGIAGDPHVLTDAEARIRHLRGKSTPDLLRLRAGDTSDAPDAVVLPGSHDEVLEVLRLCAERQIAVVPFGGGTSVVGGLEPASSGFAGVIALDVRRLNALVEIDEQSLVAELEPGLRGPQAEALLGEHGYTIGHFPQSFEYATLGGFAAARSSGQSSAGYGRFDDLVVGLRVATPAGSLELGRAPKSAAGPDLRHLVLGSEGAFGVITSLRVRIRPVPAVRVYEGWRLPSFTAGAAAIRRLLQDGPTPTVLRLSDEAETALNLARPDEVGSGGEDGGCLAIVGYEGSAATVESTRAGATEILAGAGGTVVPDAGEHWARERFRGPYLRDALLGEGALVETLETVAFWSALDGLYARVTGALRESLTAQGTPPVVLCHISHVYPTGASLYFTVACAQLPDPLAQWQRAKAAASDAILAAGGSITHHHGVGRDHVRWYEQEIGPIGVAALRAVKGALDPAGIMNPGVLLGADPSS